MVPNVNLLALTITLDPVEMSSYRYDRGSQPKDRPQDLLHESQNTRLLELAHWDEGYAQLLVLLDIK